MTIVVCINKALFPQKEIKLRISYSKFKAKTSIIQISSWGILQKVIQPTHLKTASQHRHRRHQIHYRTLNMGNHPNFLSLLKDTSQLKGSGFKSCCRLQAPPGFKQIPSYLKIQKISSGNPLLKHFCHQYQVTHSSSLHLPPQCTSSPVPLSEHADTGYICATWQRHTFTPKHCVKPPETKPY